MKISNKILKFVENCNKKDTTAVWLGLELTDLTFKGKTSFGRKDGKPLTENDYKNFVSKFHTMKRLASEKPAYHL